jgi:hypothetical protein
VANAKKPGKEKKNRGQLGPRADAKFNLPAGYKHPSFSPPPEPLFGKGKRMRSAAVAVGIIGLFGYAVWPRTDVQRNSYASKEDCEHDYATGQCSYDEGKQGNSSYSTGYHYYGPWYRSDWRTNPVQGDPGPGRTFASGSSSGASSRGPTGFDFGSRGGFGSTGRVSARGS